MKTTHTVALLALGLVAAAANFWWLGRVPGALEPAQAVPLPEEDAPVEPPADLALHPADPEHVTAGGGSPPPQAPLPQMRFRVIDAYTGEPVERFGIVVVWGGVDEPRIPGSAEPRRIPIGNYPGGEVVTSARPEIDALRLDAPDHTPGQWIVRGERVDGEELPLQTIRLMPAARIIGRLVGAEGPIEGAEIDIDSRFHIPSRESGPRALSDREGRFELRGVQFGPHLLSVEAHELGLTAVRLETKRGTVHDLGDVQLTVPAELKVFVRLPEALPAEGAVVILHQAGRFAPMVLPLHEDGTAHFPRLAAGTYAAGLARLPADAFQAAAKIVELSPGERGELELDATPQAQSHLQLQVRPTSPGLDLAGWSVELRPALWPSDIPSPTRVFGVLDSEGRLDGYFPALGAVHPRLGHGWGGSLPLPETPLVLEPGGRTEAETELSFSTLELRLPDHVQFPEQSTLQISLTLRADGELHLFRFLPASDPIADTVPQGARMLRFQRPEADRAVLTPLPTGNFTARVSLLSYPDPSTVPPNGTARFVPLYSNTLPVELAPGGQHVLELP